MGDTPFIKFYPSDFLGGTSGLSPAERGVYITLLCLIYENDGPVERNDARLARRCGAPKAAFVRVLDELIDQGKVIERDGMLSNNRAEKALIDRQNRTQNATHAAHAKWSAQAGKRQGNQRQDHAGASSAQCVADAKPEARSQKPEKKPPIVPQGGRDDFDAFWSVVPRKIAKGAARKAWAKAVKSCPPSQLIDGMKRYAEQRQGQDQQYTVHPATWLNQERWQDEAPASPQDFHKQMDQHLQEALNGLSGTNGPSGVSDQRVSKSLPAPAASGRTGGGAGDPRHSGGGEQRYLNLVKPRRFS